MQTNRADSRVITSSNLLSKRLAKLSIGDAREFKKITAEEHIQAHWHTPFVWGVHDCVMFVSSYLHKLGHKDYANAIKGRYHSSEGARTWIKLRGHSCLKSCVDSYLIQKQVTSLERGDIVMNEMGCLGIHSGNVAHFLLPKQGLIGVKPEKIETAWDALSCLRN